MEYDDLGEVSRPAVDAFAGSGYGTVVLLAVSYANLAGFRSVLTLEATVGATAAGVGLRLMDRRDRPGSDVR